MKRPKLFRTIIIVGGFSVHAAACGHYNTEEMDGSRMVTVTGCVQTVSGSRVVVLANVGAKQGAAPEERQTYRLEADRDLTEFAGKQIQVRGELTATLDDVIGQCKTRVEQYVAVHHRALEAAQQQVGREQPLAHRERALREQIQARRRDAQPGDLFTTETASLFRTMLAVPLKGREASENIAAIRDDNPDAFVPKINTQYPPTEPLSTVPPDVLGVFPRLPDGIQYRSIPGYLLLYDTRADMIIDYMTYTLRAE